MVRALMDQCMVDGIRIKLYLFDCGFSTENTSSLNELNTNYLMPYRNTHGWWKAYVASRRTRAETSCPAPWPGPMGDACNVAVVEHS